MPGFFEQLFGSRPQNRRLPTMFPEQQSALQGFFSNNIDQHPLYSSGSGYLQGLLNNSPEARADFESPYLNQFKQQILPGIAERFAGMGSGGALSSSAFNQTATQAGSALQNSLAQLRQQIMMQALPQASAYAQQPYSNLFAALNVRPFENVHTPGTPGLFGSVAPGLGSGLGNMLMNNWAGWGGR